MSAVLRRLLPLILFAAPMSAIAGDAYAVYESENDFETVIEGATMAIQERGMYINNQMHMDEMLERTVWHTTQHVRQLASLLEQSGLRPDAPLTSEDIEGLPLTDQVWDET